MYRSSVFLLIGLAGCESQPRRHAQSGGQADDSAALAYAHLQSRGHQVMGVDQYTSTHRFEPLPDGGRIVLQRDSVDAGGTAQIRQHMRTIAEAFGQGNFTLPGLVHAREVPGTAVMTTRRSQISYTADTLPRGGQVRIRSQDPAAIAAIHEFLAFQRRDHRSGGAE
jgi:hypothetical protein